MSAAALEQRVSAALQEPVEAAELSSLIDEVATAVVELERRSQKAAEASLDPSVSPADAGRARGEAEALNFQRARLDRGLGALRAKSVALEKERADAERRKLYAEVENLRDGLADELARVYPEAVALLSNLFLRIRACDQQIAVVNKRLPAGVLALVDVERRARKLDRPSRHQRREPLDPLIPRVRLPIFEDDEARSRGWPLEASATPPAFTPRVKEQEVVVTNSFAFMVGKRRHIVPFGRATLAEPVAKAAARSGFAVEPDTNAGRRALARMGQVDRRATIEAILAGAERCETLDFDYAVWAREDVADQRQRWEAKRGGAACLR